MVELRHDSRPIIGRGPPLGATFLTLALLSVALMVADHRYPQIQRVRSWLTTIAFPVQIGVDLPFRAWNWLGQSFADRKGLRAENLELTGVNGRVRLVEHDLTSGLGEANFDLVVSNPPYVEPDELPRLQPEVRDWEPHVALVASGATEKLAQAATEALRPGGWLVLEVAAGAGERVERLLRDLGFEEVTITPDLAGRDRVAEARWPV